LAKVWRSVQRSLFRPYAWTGDPGIRGDLGARRDDAKRPGSDGVTPYLPPIVLVLVLVLVLDL
jgi:hypothetical protein